MLASLGVVELSVTTDLKPFEKIMILDFVVVEENSSYQMIFGRLFMKITQSVMSTQYLALKY